MKETQSSCSSERGYLSSVMSTVANARLKAKEMQLKAAKEAEAKAKEEERRIQAQLLEQERLKHEEKLRKDMENRRQQEHERLKAEHTELKQILDNISDQLKFDFQAVADEEEWRCYLGDLQELELTNLKNVNTFISTARVEDVYTSTKEQILSALSTSCQMIEAVDNRIAAVRTSNVRIRQTIPKLTEALGSLRMFIRQHTDLYRFAALRTAVQNCSGKSGNYESRHKSNYFQLSLWGNLSKSSKKLKNQFRFKTFDFGPIEIEFPASVYTNDVAVTVLSTRITAFVDVSDGTVDKRDRLYTNNANVFYLENLPEEPKINNKEIPTIIEPDGETVDAPVKEKPNKPKVEKKKITKRKKLLKGAASLGDMAKKTALAPISDSLLDTDENKKRKTNSFRRASMIAAATITLTAKAATHAEVESSDVVDVASMCPLGEIHSVRGYRLPPQPIEVGHWTVYPVVSPTLKPFDTLQGESCSLEPLNVTLRLEPDKYLLSEEPTLAFYDSNSNQWRTSYITHAQYEKDNKLIKFRLHKFGEFGLFSKLSIQLPYHSWMLKPLGKSHLEFIIRTPIIKLYFEIKDDKIKVKCPGVYEWIQVRSIGEKWVSLSQMLKMLRSIGVDLFPNSDTPTPEAIQRKTDKTEDKVYRNLAQLASVMTFTQSRWNSSLSADTVVFRSCHPDYMEDIAEEEWPVFMYALNIFRKMNITDKSSRFKESFDNKIAPHISMLHMVKEMLKVELTEDLISRNSNVFTVTVYKWLSLLQILSFTL